MGWAISHIWHLVTQDIENTLHKVGSAVVDDKSIDEVKRHRRAEALYEISKIFGVSYLTCKISADASLRTQLPQLQHFVVLRNRI